MVDDDFFQQIRADFLSEAQELLLNVENLSLTLSKNLHSDEVFGELARLAHNFKGTGKAVGFDTLSLLGHKTEDLILCLKSRPETRSQKSIDFLFKCLDVLKFYVSDLAVDHSMSLDISGIVSEIEAFISSESMIDVEKFVTEDKAEDKLSENHVEPSPHVAAKQHKSHSQNANDSFRIPKQKLDYLLDCFGEQIILQSSLDQLKLDFEDKKDEIIKIINLLSKQTIELQKQVLSLTMVPLAPLFTKLERAARDVARMCGKEVDIEFFGGELEADKILVDSISDSLVHMIRNSVDHGIETIEKRFEIDKNPAGKIIVQARRVGSQLWIDMIDDGAGIDVVKVKNKALEKGVISQEKFNTIEDKDAYKLIFENGFSTKEQVSEVSGRGVGMNVVLESVEHLKGEVNIDSKLGSGTCFRLKLPLSLAIFNGAIIRVHETRYVVPTSDIAEITYPGKNYKVHQEDLKSFVRCRDEIFELVDLRDQFSAKAVKSDSAPYLILTRKGKKICYAVDEILGVQRIVQKNLSEEIKMRKGFVAGTILGDGSPGIVLSLSALTNKSA